MWRRVVLWWATCLIKVHGVTSPTDGIFNVVTVNEVHSCYAFCIRVFLLNYFFKLISTLCAYSRSLSVFLSLCVILFLYFLPYISSSIFVPFLPTSLPSLHIFPTFPSTLSAGPVPYISYYWQSASANVVSDLSFLCACSCGITVKRNK